MFSNLVQASPRCKHRSEPTALDLEQARHTHPPSARARALNGRQEHQKDCSMAALKWASTGLGWGRGLSRLRTRYSAHCSPLG